MKAGSMALAAPKRLAQVTLKRFLWFDGLYRGKADFRRVAAAQHLQSKRGSLSASTAAIHSLQSHHREDPRISAFDEDPGMLVHV
jgi:hypothetical protein